MPSLKTSFYFTHLLGLCLGTAFSPHTHAETCGIDLIFANGLETPTFTSIGQIPGGVTSPGLTQSITGNGQFSVAITSPLPGAATGESSVDVSGTFTGPTNTGIVINGVVAATNNGQFLASGIPLQAGSNTLTATATKLDGTTATAFVTVTQSGTTSPLSLQASGVTGYAPIKPSFTLAVGTLPNNGQLQSLTVDFNGDNINEFTGTSLTGIPSSYTYTQPGMYVAHARLIDTNNVTYDAYRRVLVEDLAVQRGMLCDIHQYVKAQLMAQNATQASLAYQSVNRSNYYNLFAVLGTNMPAAAQKLGTIVNGVMGNGFAEMLLVRDNANQTRSGFPLRITQGADGVWRISEM